MKRIWFAIIFLALAAAMCGGEQHYIDCTYDLLNKKISTAEAALKRGDTELYRQCAEDIESIWKEKNDLLYAFGEHGTLDSVAVEIRSMPFEKGEELKELHSLRAMLKAYYENERISLSNIL